MNKAIIIIARNEKDWPKKTVENLHENVPNAKIVCVDDGGKNSWGDKADVVLKTSGGVGVGRSRLLGAQKTINSFNSDILLTADGHVKYDSGEIKRAWELAENGYIVAPTTKSLNTGNKYGCCRTINLNNKYKCKNYDVPEGMEASLIGSCYFMRKDVALDIIAPTKSQGYNEQIMTLAAFCFGHKIYTFPDLCFSHKYKKKFNYKITHKEQDRNRKILTWWFFGGKKPRNVNLQENRYNKKIQKHRVLNCDELKKKVVEMNQNIRKKGNKC